MAIFAVAFLYNLCPICGDMLAHRMIKHQTEATCRLDYRKAYQGLYLFHPRAPR